MSYNPCTNPITCSEGNCIGCENSQIWCQDPRCAPYCSGCAPPTNLDFVVNMTVIIILVCLIAILFIVWFIYGPRFFHPHSNYEQANILIPTSSE